jgi:hypothetical protein
MDPYNPAYWTDFEEEMNAIPTYSFATLAPVRTVPEVLILSLATCFWENEELE